MKTLLVVCAFLLVSCSGPYAMYYSDMRDSYQNEHAKVNIALDSIGEVMDILNHRFDERNDNGVAMEEVERETYLAIFQVMKKTVAGIKARNKEAK